MPPPPSPTPSPLWTPSPTWTPPPQGRHGGQGRIYDITSKGLRTAVALSTASCSRLHSAGVTRVVHCAKVWENVHTCDACGLKQTQGQKYSKEEHHPGDHVDLHGDRTRPLFSRWKRPRASKLREAQTRHNRPNNNRFCLFHPVLDRSCDQAPLSVSSFEVKDQWD